MGSTNNYGLATALENDMPGVWGLMINDNYKRYEQMVGGFSVVTVNSPPAGSSWASGSNTLTWIPALDVSADSVGSEYRAKHIRFDYSGTASSPVTVNMRGSGSTDRDSDMVMIVENNIGQTLSIGQGSTGLVSILSGKSAIVVMRKNAGGSSQDQVSGLGDILLGNLVIPGVAPFEYVLGFLSPVGAGGQVKISEDDSAGLRFMDSAGGEVLKIDSLSDSISTSASISCSENVSIGSGISVSSGDSSVQDLDVLGDLSVTGVISGIHDEFVPVPTDNNIDRDFNPVFPDPNPPVTIIDSPSSSFPSDDPMSGVNSPLKLSNVTFNLDGRSGNTRALFFGSNISASTTFGSDPSIFNLRGCMFYFYKQTVSLNWDTGLPVTTRSSFELLPVTGAGTQQKPCNFLGNVTSTGPLFYFWYADNIPATVAPGTDGRNGTTTNISVIYFKNPESTYTGVDSRYNNSIVATGTMGFWAIDFGVSPS